MGESKLFTWDDNKDRENRLKHGIPLVAAKALLHDPFHLDSPTRSAVSGELRRFLIGQRGETVLSCVYLWGERKRHAVSFARPAEENVVPTKRTWTRAEIDAELANVDWSRIDRMTDEEVETAAAADPDSHLPTDEELGRAVRERAVRLSRARKRAAE